MAEVVRKANKNNVSTVKGVAGGYLFTAPLGTPVPENYWDELGPDFACAGYVTEDGMTEEADGSSEDIKDMNGDVVGDYDEGTTETLGFALMEISEESMAMRYGHENVSSDEHQMAIDHNWSKSKEDRVVVADLVMKNKRRWRKVIPQGTVSERGGIQLNGSNAASHEVTVKYLTDENGSGCKDYIQKLNENGIPVAPPDAQKALDDMTIDELKAYAAANSIDITGKTLKQEILDAIKAAMNTEGAE